MPFTPLRLNKIADVRASLIRLQQQKLIRIKKFDSHWLVKPQPELAELLMVAVNGETYLLSDVLALTKEEARQSDIKFVTKHGGLRSIEQIQQGKLDYLLHNRPLAYALNSLRFNSRRFHIEIDNTGGILFPFPAVFPVITEAEETQEALRLKDFNEKYDQYHVAIPNKALETLVLGSSKSADELALYELGLSVLRQDALVEDQYDAVDAINIMPQIQGLSPGELHVLRRRTERKVEQLEGLLAMKKETYDIFKELLREMPHSVLISGPAAAALKIQISVIKHKLNLLDKQLSAIDQYTQYLQNEDKRMDAARLKQRKHFIDGEKQKVRQQQRRHTIQHAPRQQKLSDIGFFKSARQVNRVRSSLVVASKRSLRSNLSN